MGDNVHLDISEAFTGMPDNTLSYGSGNRGTNPDTFAINSGVTTFLKFRTQKEGASRFSVTDYNMSWHRHVFKIELLDSDFNYLKTSSGADYKGSCDVGIGEEAYTDTVNGKSYHGSPVLEHDTEYYVALVHTGAEGGTQKLDLRLTKYYGPERPESDPAEPADEFPSVTMIIDGVAGHWRPDAET
jgi:hypothetical protein